MQLSSPTTMPPSSRRALSRPLLLAALLLLTSWQSPAAALSRGDYINKLFRGEGTYYGMTTGGNCAFQNPLPSIYSKMVPVAINDKQYDDSRSCGACLKVDGTGRGLGGSPIRGPFLAYVHDRCPECAPGDLDLSKNGDGRWQISWRFIPCPLRKSGISVEFEGSNDFYLKVQIRGLMAPPTKVTHARKTGLRTQDNFFIFHGAVGRVLQFEVDEALGGRAVIRLPKWHGSMGNKIVLPVDVEYWPGKPIPGSNGGFSGGKTPPKKQPPPPTPPKRKPPSPPKRKPPQPPKRPPNKPKKQCVPDWKACSPPWRRSHWSSTCCGKNFRCVRPSNPWWWQGKRCVYVKPRAPRKCVPNWRACSGRNNKWGTGVCCGKFRCVRSSQRSFVGKRCEPR